MCKKTIFIFVFSCTFSLLGYYDPEQVEARYKATHKLFRAMYTGCMGKAQKALNRGAYIDYQRGSDNATPLIIATRMKHHAIVTILLAQHANVHYQTIYGRTALEYALADHQFEIAQQLVDHGAHPFTINLFGVSPFYSAYLSDDFQTIHFLNTYLHRLHNPPEKKLGYVKRANTAAKRVPSLPMYGPELPPWQ